MPNKAADAFKPTAEVDADSYAFLLKALDRVKHGKLSYLDLRVAVEKLVSSGQSPEQALDSVLVTAEALGVSRGQLLREARAHHKALDDEHSKLEEAMRKRLTDGLAADEQAIATLEGELADLEQQREALDAKLTRGRGKLERLRTELGEVQERVRAKGSALATASEHLRAQIDADIQRLTSTT